MADSIIEVYGTPWCPDCTRSKKFLTDKNVPFEWFDVDEDEEKRKYVVEVKGGKQSVPTILFPDGSVLVEPSNRQLAEKLGV